MSTRLGTGSGVRDVGVCEILPSLGHLSVNDPASTAMACAYSVEDIGGKRSRDDEPPTAWDRLKVRTSIKVLVLCHPHPFEGHWQENVIRQRTGELFADRLAAGETLDFFTLDPLRDPHNHADFPFGFVQNLFQVTKFSTTERWDMVWAPDCGGEWYEMMNMKGDAQREQFTNLVLTMSLSLKPGGFMMLGKLPFGKPEWSDTTLEQAVGLLSEAGFARAESASVPVPDEPDANPLAYILVQKKGSS